MIAITAPSRCEPLDRHQIENRLRNCARLPSLSTINSALRALLTADQRYTSHVAEIIRRDPSLAARLLRLVNSVYYGLTTPISSIEEAVFYLGVRQIRQLSMITPIIEDFQKMAGNTRFAWREFWRHCIGTAIMTREVFESVRTPTDEADYVAGLIHDVGKIIMASTFPEHFVEIHRRLEGGAGDLLTVEDEVLGLDHAELGAVYLKSHSLPDLMVETSRFHHQPERASHHAQIIAAVQIADLLVRHARIGHSGNGTQVTTEHWLNASGWGILYPHLSEEEKAIARANLKRSLDRLPSILEGLV